MRRHGGVSMAYADRDRRQEQAASATASLILGAGLFASLLLASQTAQILPGRDALPSIAFDLESPPPPPPPPPPPAEAVRERAPEPEGASAPPAKRAAATQITAPKPKIMIDRPNPAPAAPVQGPGNETRSGATDFDGPGTGAGGQGMGTGSGNSGLGMGGGGGGGKARHIKGRIRNGDYPKSASREGRGGSVTVWYTVQPDGRVTNCAVRISSGNADLDSTTCRLIEKRFRYEPARDANGRAVASQTGWRQDYWLEAPDWGG